jgi:hypothetical protein
MVAKFRHILQAYMTFKVCHTMKPTEQELTSSLQVPCKQVTTPLQLLYINMHMIVSKNQTLKMPYS